MKKMTIEATYRVVTPLFCAGVDQKNGPELRLPSFKGVLRYWWRALAWSRCRSGLGVLRQQEDRLFGSANGGQSRVLMRMATALEPEAVAQPKVLSISASSDGVVGDGARYLGYGLMEAKSSKKGTEAGQIQRGCLRSPFDFTVQMRARRLDDREFRSLTDALIALGTLGGLGARSRRGYGSVALESLRVNGQERWPAPTTAGELRDSIASLHHERHEDEAELPPFTALSKKARHVLLANGERAPVELLDLVGREFVRFRSWGYKGRVLGQQSERNFQRDHDLMKTNWRQRKTHPERIAFGLPHNYGKYDDQKVGPWDEFDRRASPLFIHLHQCDRVPVAVLSFLPARFLPNGRSAISVGGSRVAQRPEAELYKPVHDFLDRLSDPQRRRESFAEVMEVPR